MEPNLLSHSRTNGAEVDRSLVKLIALGSLGVLAAAASGFFLSQYAGGAATSQNFWLLSGGLVALLVVILLQTFFVKSLSKVAALAVAYMVALLAPLLTSLSSLALLGWGAALVCVVWGNASGNRELRDRVKIRFCRISRLTLGKAVTGLSLFLTLYYLGTQAGGIVVSRPLFEQLLLPASGAFERLFSGISLTDTFEEAIKELAASQAKALPGFETLPPAAQRELLSRAERELEAQAMRLLGIPARPDVRLVDLLHEAFAAKLSGLGTQGKRLAFLAEGALVFFVLRGLGVFFTWAALGIGFVAYEILIALGFASIVLEGGSREIIVL